MSENITPRPRNSVEGKNHLSPDSMLDGVDPSLTKDSIRNTVSLGDIKYLGEDVALPVPKGVDPITIRNITDITLEYLGEPDTDEGANIPVIDFGNLAGYRFGFVETGGYLARVSRVFGTIEQIKTGTFDYWPDIENEFRDYLGFSSSKMEETVVLDPNGIMISMCRISLGTPGADWKSFEMSQIYNLTGEDNLLSPVDQESFSALEKEIRSKGVGLENVMEVPAVAIREEYQNSEIGSELLMIIDAAGLLALCDIKHDLSRGRDYVLSRGRDYVIVSTQRELTGVLQSVFNFKPFGPITKEGTTPMWAPLGVFIDHYHGALGGLVRPYAQHLNLQRKREL